MTDIKIPYGKSHLNLNFPAGVNVDLIDPANQAGSTTPLEMVTAALRNPLGNKKTQYNAARQVVVAINDKTRPVPHHLLLPPLLNWLEDEYRLQPDNISLVVATGTHTPMRPEEFHQILPEDILARYPVRSHDCDAPDLVELGTTNRGTPVRVNRHFYEADLKIVVGTIEPHHFAGFSGGQKTAAIGLTGRNTINHNHAMLIDPLATIGEFERNPLRQDIEEIGSFIGTQLALNAVLNANRELIAALFGSPEAVINAGIPISRAVTQTRVAHRYDLVIASAGGHPKDINFYQAQKALTYASLLARDGGTIILVAACPEGSGSQSYERFMQNVGSYNEVFQKFAREGFQVGPHKALQVAKIGQRVQVILISEMPDNLVRMFLMTPAGDLEIAIRNAHQDISATTQIAILPHATNTIPIVDTAG